MVLGLLGITAIPATIGIAEATKNHEDPEEEAERDRECHLSVFCGSDSPRQKEVHGKYIVLRDNKVYIGNLSDKDSHPFTGFYITYPCDESPPPRGLVSMISLNPPAMGWIYADSGTLEAKYGNRSASIEHVKGPWDWTSDQTGVTLEGKEAFVAVEEEVAVEDGKTEKRWALYFDRTETGKGLPRGKQVLPISLDRNPTKPKEVTKESTGKKVTKKEA